MIDVFNSSRSDSAKAVSVGSNERRGIGQLQKTCEQRATELRGTIFHHRGARLFLMYKLQADTITGASELRRKTCCAHGPRLITFSVADSTSSTTSEGSISTRVSHDKKRDRGLFVGLVQRGMNVLNKKEK